MLVATGNIINEDDPMPELDALLPLPAVKIATGLSRATIYEKVADGTFPAPFKLGRASRWSSAELRKWHDVQRAKRDAARAAALIKKRPHLTRNARQGR